jgi:uncharacterized SAM-binding protein YcdF (DUF218 family)
METAEAPRTISRRLFWTVVAAAAALLVELGLVFSSVLRDAEKQELRPADAIVVFGAAEYDGRPSPVFRARLDHAEKLFRQGLAPIIITTGGAGADPKFTEGGVGRDYLMRRGIPESALIAETQASNTAESAERVTAIMAENHMTSCVAVSDAYHMFRIQKLLAHQGVKVFLAPRPDSRPKSAWSRVATVSKESASYLLWRLGLRT